MRRMLVVLTLGIMWFGALSAASFKLIGLIRDSRLTELSGIAASSHSDRHYWGMNDGGNGNLLHRFEQTGRILQSVELEGVGNRDIEDMSAFQLDGKAYLAIADVGDNQAIHGEYQIHIVPEPKRGTRHSKPEWTIRYRYPDRAHDCESIFVDPREKAIYLVIKRVEPARLFRIDLSRSTAVQTAQDLGPLQGIRPVKFVPSSPSELPLPNSPDPEATSPTDVPFDPNQTRFSVQPTGATLSCDGRVFYLLTYGALYRYSRRAHEDWGAALARIREPKQLPLPPTLQAEAVTITRNCKALLVGSEKVPSPLWQFSLDSFNTKK